MDSSQNVDYLVVDTTGFIQNSPLQNIGKNIVTCQEVVNEITNKRQLRRLIVLPYDLSIKNVYPESIQVITEFAKKTGDYPCLSATDIKVMALTYQLEKEHVGTDHLNNEPIRRNVNFMTKSQPPPVKADVVGFYDPKNKTDHNPDTSVEQGDDDRSDDEINNLDELDDQLLEKFHSLDCDDIENEDDAENILVSITDQPEGSQESDSDDDIGWITPSNIKSAKKQLDGETTEEISVKVACITTDFAMQNVLKQMNLNVATLDGRMIKQLRTFILRCHACFKTTSIMTKIFCPKCGNKTLKRVAVTLDEEGNQQIHINARRPITGRGKRYSLPTIKGGKHSNNPHLVEDQPFPDQQPTRLAKTKTNPLNDDYIAGFSPFVMRDVTSKSAQLKIRPHSTVKHWMKKNPNEAFRRKK
ncbi:hypothetical protein PPYR_08973 [Photinus pyralis]|uniref:RNA-binding protein NOB1 n=1 Tax=Photinus pyralis TaxID=7054 RepID=A0A1Y1L034_PHOPY|nr:RNA-binding protein NOB1 [Photinus pyralis]KAB0797980.1 hypothetical protein PPYR_08973 [Photinus pyralis]